LASWSQSSGFTLPFVPEESTHPAHLFYLHAPDLAVRTQFIDYLKENGVMAVFHYQALNTSKVGLEFGGKVGDCPVSEKAAETLVRLPLFYSLTDSELDKVVSTIQKFPG
jgi:dTDP-4-amino-4,6-dideoxygalactose transaminase